MWLAAIVEASSLQNLKKCFSILYFCFSIKKNAYGSIIRRFSCATGSGKIGVAVFKAFFWALQQQLPIQTPPGLSVLGRAPWPAIAFPATLTSSHTINSTLEEHPCLWALLAYTYSRCCKPVTPPDMMNFMTSVLDIAKGVIASLGTMYRLPEKL